MDAPVLIIGGKPVTVPPVSFAAVRRAIPSLDTMAAAGRASPDAPVLTHEQQVCMVLDVLCALVPVLDRASIEEQLLNVEMPGLMDGYRQVLEWAGLVAAVPGKTTATN